MLMAGWEVRIGKTVTEVLKMLPYELQTAKQTLTTSKTQLNLLIATFLAI